MLVYVIEMAFKNRLLSEVYVRVNSIRILADGFYYFPIMAANHAMQNGSVRVKTTMLSFIKQ